MEMEVEDAGEQQLTALSTSPLREKKKPVNLDDTAMERALAAAAALAAALALATAAPVAAAKETMMTLKTLSTIALNMHTHTNTHMSRRFEQWVSGGDGIRGQCTHEARWVVLVRAAKVALLVSAHARTHLQHRDPWHIALAAH